MAQLPGLRRLVVNRTQPDPSGALAAWDAIAEDWFDSHEAMQAALASPQGQSVNADAATFHLFRERIGMNATKNRPDDWLG